MFKTILPKTPLDDPFSVMAIAALAICTTALAHEALGHGGACLGSGARITVMSNADFACSHFGRSVAIAGPLTNVIVSLLALVSLRAISANRPALKLYALLVMAFGLFWEAGYLVMAMTRGSGDTLFAWRDWIGPETPLVRGLGIGLGLSAYGLIYRGLAHAASDFGTPPERVRYLLRAAFLTALAVMAFSASLYDPDRWGAVRDASLSVLASFPMLFVRIGAPSDHGPANPIRRHLGLIGLTSLVVALFAATLGVGLR